ncbi:MAG: GNAT family N-acetyltransferase [Ferruginibacter sp.]
MLTTNFTLIQELTTDRLVLRKLVLADAPQILNMRGDDAVMQYIGKDKILTIADAETFINWINKSLDENEGITWAITLKETPHILIGTVGFWRLIKQHYRAELGYMLSPDYWKKGIMKEAILKLIEIGFTDIKLHSIEAHINPDNKASASVLLSTGFKREACLKENFYYKGLFRDTEIYSLLQKPV